MIPQLLALCNMIPLSRQASDITKPVDGLQEFVLTSKDPYLKCYAIYTIQMAPSHIL